MANAAWPIPAAVAAPVVKPRHSLLVRITHWITTICVIALLVTGIEIIISHPRFYWGDTGNPMTPSLFDIPIPASRPWVNTGYNYVLPDQNGWSRSVHFDAAWIILLTGLIYVLWSLVGRHLRNDLLPDRSVTLRALWKDIAHHLRFRRPPASEAFSYNVLQRLTYLCVIFILLPITTWTGFAQSPTLVAAFPILGTIPDGHQSARTVHFFTSVLLTLFLIVHIVMVVRAGFRARMRAMITGGSSQKGQSI